MPSFDPFVRAEAPGVASAPSSPPTIRYRTLWDPADTPKGDAMSPHQLTDRAAQHQPALGRAEAVGGLDWLRLHDLRHGCATFMLAAGVPSRAIPRPSARRSPVPGSSRGSRRYLRTSSG